MNKKTRKPDLNDRKLDKTVKDRGDNQLKQDNPMFSDETAKPFSERGDAEKIKNDGNKLVDIKKIDKGKQMHASINDKNTHDKKLDDTSSKFKQRHLNQTANEKDVKKIDNRVQYQLQSGFNDKNKIYDTKQDETRSKYNGRNVNLKTVNERGVMKKTVNKEQNQMSPVAEERRIIKDNYSFNNNNRTTNNSNMNNKNDVTKSNIGRQANSELKNDQTSKKIYDHKDKNDASDVSRRSESIKQDKDATKQKRPIVKTTISKNDATKVYKAVTFTDQRKQKSMAIQINIPNEVQKPKNMVEPMKTSLSRVSIKEKSSRRKTSHKKREKKLKHSNSPDLSSRIRSPPTGVAKWAPSCINSHTKQYYEAWVDTTLAAITKQSRRDKLFLENKRFIEALQRALAERPISPDLDYENLNDERYIGRIKVRQR
ncbi:MATH and LRR domain-containing protein PFE0570w-like [Achroia grisella]|uniref:MATH and LRR domain-containing protein PFE0570w-like n=1 Tax=Achroia grisella TaxID=688607 RepID=UPI0027D28E4C|nr:MATH and LRR domain-containing protein PFE0570w-like [Achroia grisella]